MVGVCAEVRRRHGLDDVKLVLITNASLFHRERVRRGLEILDANNGEIWAKLDAGTEAYYRLRSPARRSRCAGFSTTFAEAARARPIVIQSLFMRIDGEPPADAETGGLLRPAERDRRRRRADQAGAGPHRRPAAGRDLGRAAGQRRGRRDRRAGSRETGLPVSTFYGEFKR